MCGCYLKDNFHDIWFHVPIKAVIVSFCYHFCSVTCRAWNVKSSLSYYNWHASYMEFMIPDIFMLWHVFQTNTALPLQHIKRIASRFSNREIPPQQAKFCPCTFMLVLNDHTVCAKNSRNFKWTCSEKQNLNRWKTWNLNVHNRTAILLVCSVPVKTNIVVYKHQWKVTTHV